MAKTAPENIRNVALIGHNGTGKTTLTEALLFACGAIKKKGSVADKNTVSDFDPDEKERGHSIETSITHFEHAGKYINLLDCPGLPDFSAGAIQGLAAADLALIAVSGPAGVEVMTRKLWASATTNPREHTERARTSGSSHTDHGLRIAQTRRVPRPPSAQSAMIKNERRLLAPTARSGVSLGSNLPV